MNGYKIIDFDLTKAKTPENPNGLDVVTKNGRGVRIICTDKHGGNPIIALVDMGNKQETIHYDQNGIIGWDGNTSFGLVLKEPIKYRKMTNQELSKWLREKPEEFRETMTEHSSLIKSTYDYFQEYENHAVADGLMIRSNYGEWREPLIEI